MHSFTYTGLPARSSSGPAGAPNCPRSSISSACAAHYDLAESIGASLTLADLDRAAEIAVQNPYYKPREITQDGIRALLDNAYHSRRPEA